MGKKETFSLFKGNDITEIYSELISDAQYIKLEVGLCVVFCIAKAIVI